MLKLLCVGQELTSQLEGAINYLPVENRGLTHGYHL